jgi:dipeptidyl aminopeptidase/acylaminoacyl peptidase
MNGLRIRSRVLLSLLALGVGAMLAATPASAGEQVVLGDIVAMQTSPAIPSELAGRDVLFYGNLADLSRNGEELLYVYVPDQSVQPWEMRIASLVTSEILVRTVLPLETYPHAGRGAFSPDGEWIATDSAAEGPPARNVIAPLIVRRDGTGLRRLRDDGYDYTGPSWGPDGRRIAFLRTLVERATPDEPDGGTQLVEESAAILDVATGDVLSVYEGLVAPRFSPDGRRLLAFEGSCLVTADLSTGARTLVWDPRPLAPPGSGEWRVVNFAWVSDSARVLFTANHWAVDLPGEPIVWEVHEANLQDGQTRKVAAGRLAAAGANGRWFVLDYRTSEQTRARREAGQPLLQPGDVALLSVLRIGR